MWLGIKVQGAKETDVQVGVLLIYTGVGYAVGFARVVPGKG